MLEAVQRANIVYSETLGPEPFGIIEKPLTLAEKIYNQSWLRKVAHARRARAGVAALRTLARQSAAGADVRRHGARAGRRTWATGQFQAGR